VLIWLSVGEGKLSRAGSFAKLQFNMNKITKIFVILTFVVLISLTGLFLIGYFKPKGAGLEIKTTPAALVFIDGIQVGQTPYNTVRNPGEITLKLVPQSTDVAFLPFETRVTLVSGINTIVKREFGKTEDEETGEIVSFEKVGGNDTSLAVVSLPDSAQVKIDGRISGYAPVKVSSLTVGTHQIVISAAGYLEHSLSVNTINGYKLVAVVKLAKGETSSSPTPSSQPIAPRTKYLIEILSTPNGFLRVRATPSTTGEEIARVNSGKKFPLVEEDSQSGWFKIEFEEGKEGWVSNVYSKKVEVKENSSPTSKSSPTPTF